MYIYIIICVYIYIPIYIGYTLSNIIIKGICVENNFIFFIFLFEKSII